MDRDTNDIVYRSNIVSYLEEKPEDNNNVKDYRALLEVQEALKSAIEKLYKDFNSFDIFPKEKRKNAEALLLREIEARKKAYDILYPILQMVESAIDSINKKGV